MQEIQKDLLLVASSKGQINVYDIKTDTIVNNIDPNYTSECNYVLIVND